MKLTVFGDTGGPASIVEVVAGRDAVVSAQSARDRGPTVVGADLAHLILAVCAEPDTHHVAISVAR